MNPYSLSPTGQSHATGFDRGADREVLALRTPTTSVS